jgi:hypothetical protein
LQKDILLGSLGPENEGTMLLQSICKYLFGNKVSHCRRFESSASLLLKSNNSYHENCALLGYYAVSNGNYSTLCNNPEEHSSHQHRGRSLKSCTKALPCLGTTHCSVTALLLG